MRKMIIPRGAILLLVAGALMLPVAISVLCGLGRLVVAMGDSTGASALNWIALAAGVFWVLDLVCLVVGQAINSLSADDTDPPESP